jgi:hypothetical protein
MIDKQVFAAGMGVLANNFNKTVDAALSRIWYNTLSAKLTTEQFERAVTLSVEQDTFWPTAAALIAKVAPDSPETRGAAALEHVNRVLSAHGGHRFLPHATYLAEFDEPTRAAISAVGGLADITNCSIERWASMTKKFAAAYAKAVDGPKALPAPPTDARVKQIVSGTARNLSIVSGRDRAAGEQP